jgi:hypothetical protein
VQVIFEYGFSISIFESAIRVFLEGFDILRVRFIESRLCIYSICIEVLYQFYMELVWEDV